MIKRKRSSRLNYVDAPDLQQRMVEIVKVLGMDHVRLDSVKCLRSQGSSSRGTIARCHTLGKLMQKAMGTKAFYAIEFLEPFERMSKADQDKTIIHELMHIPKSFGGGFRHHDFVCEENVNLLHEKFENLRKGQAGWFG
jgi:predicted metallopeptidase